MIQYYDLVYDGNEKNKNKNKNKTKNKQTKTKTNKKNPKQNKKQNKTKQTTTTKISSWCIQNFIVLHRPTSANASLLRGYPRCAYKYSQHSKLLWKTSIDRRRLMLSDEVWIHHHGFAVFMETILLCDLFPHGSEMGKKQTKNAKNNSNVW